MTTPRKRRPVLRYIAIALLILLTPVFVLAATVVAAGAVTVRVEQEGETLFIPFPAILLDVALWAAPRLIPDEALEDARAEIEPFRPALQEVAKEIQDIPDATIVKVENGDETVQVLKRGGSFRVLVDDQEVEVDVRVPARLMRRALNVFG